MAVQSYQPAAAPQAGSLHWLAWLFSPPAAREITATLFAVEIEWRSVLSAHVDHSVAHLKLQWWREEILRLERGEPRHPLAQSAHRLTPSTGAAWRPLQDFLGSLDLDLARAPLEDEPALDRYLSLADGLLRTLALALAPDRADPRFEAAGRTVGQMVRCVELARDLSAASPDNHVGVGMAQLIARSRICGQAADRALSELPADALRGLRVYGRLHLALLDRIECAIPASKLRPATLGPVRRLWTAWHAARQH